MFSNKKSYHNLWGFSNSYKPEEVELLYKLMIQIILHVYPFKFDLQHPYNCDLQQTYID